MQNQRYILTWCSKKKEDKKQDKLKLVFFTVYFVTHGEVPNQTM